MTLLIAAASFCVIWTVACAVAVCTVLDRNWREEREGWRICSENDRHERAQLLDRIANPQIVYGIPEDESELETLTFGEDEEIRRHREETAALIQRELEEREALL